MKMTEYKVKFGNGKITKVHGFSFLDAIIEAKHYAHLFTISDSIEYITDEKTRITNINLQVGYDENDSKKSFFNKKLDKE